MDHAAEVKKLDAAADDAIVKAIIRHCGIALQKRDSSLVSCSDPEELKRVRESWGKKKLGLTDEGAIDAAIKSVCEDMKASRDKSRVAFYYLVAKKLGKLDSLVKAS
jgi:hypothetical protein